MREKLLKLKPKNFLCPYCGQWHKWTEPHELGYYAKYDNTATCKCSNIPSRWFDKNSANVAEDDVPIYKIYFEENALHYLIPAPCRSTNSDSTRVFRRTFHDISIYNIYENLDKAIVTFDVTFGSICEQPLVCDGCDFFRSCYLYNLHFKITSWSKPFYGAKIELGFEFEKSEFDMCDTKATPSSFKKIELKECMEDVKDEEQSLQEPKNKDKELEQQQAPVEQSTQSKIKEDHIMTTKSTKRTTLKEQLYEKSPKENFEIVKAWAEKYKPVLKWAIPISAVYCAYRILNSNEFDLSVNNIADTCEKQLGFKVKFLENKKALKELMVIGGLSAGAYGAVKAASCIFGTEDISDISDISVEEVDSKMSQLESISKKFAWIQPKTEDMLPIAFSVILVYVTLHKPKFTGKVSKITEDISIRLNTYIDLAKLFIQDKFNIDLSDKEGQKKMKICVFLTASMAIFAFLYGKKVLEDKTTTEEAGKSKEERIRAAAEIFVEQAKVIIKKIAPSVYTSIITLFVSKKILDFEDPLEIFDVDENAVNIVDETETPIQETPEE